MVLPGTDRADDERLELDQWKMLLYGPEKRTYAGGLCDAGRNLSGSMSHGVSEVRYRRLERNDGGGSVWKRKKEGDGWLDFWQSL